MWTFQEAVLRSVAPAIGSSHISCMSISMRCSPQEICTPNHCVSISLSYTLLLHMVSCAAT